MTRAPLFLLLLLVPVGGCVAATIDAVYAIDESYQKGEAVLDYARPMDQVVAAAKAEWPLLTKNKMVEQKTSKGYPMLTDKDLITVIIRPHPGVPDEYTRVGARIGSFGDEKRREITGAYLDAIGKRLGIKE